MLWVVAALVWSLADVGATSPLASLSVRYTGQTSMLVNTITISFDQAVLHFGLNDIEVMRSPYHTHVLHETSSGQNTTFELVASSPTFSDKIKVRTVSTGPARTGSNDTIQTSAPVVAAFLEPSRAPDEDESVAVQLTQLSPTFAAVSWRPTPLASTFTVMARASGSVGAARSDWRTIATNLTGTDANVTAAGLSQWAAERHVEMGANGTWSFGGGVVIDIMVLTANAHGQQIGTHAVPLTVTPNSTAASSMPYVGIVSTAPTSLHVQFSAPDATLYQVEVCRIVSHSAQKSNDDDMDDFILAFPGPSFAGIKSSEDSSTNDTANATANSTANASANTTTDVAASTTDTSATSTSTSTMTVTFTVDTYLNNTHISNFTNHLASALHINPSQITITISVVSQKSTHDSNATYSVTTTITGLNATEASNAVAAMNSTTTIQTLFTDAQVTGVTVQSITTAPSLTTITTTIGTPTASPSASPSVSPSASASASVTASVSASSSTSASPSSSVSGVALGFDCLAYETVANDVSLTSLTISSYQGNPIDTGESYRVRVRGRNAAHGYGSDDTAATVKVAATAAGFQATVQPDVNVIGAAVQGNSGEGGQVTLFIEHTTSSLYRVEAWDPDLYVGNIRAGGWQLVVNDVWYNRVIIDCLSNLNPCPRGDRLLAGELYPIRVSAGSHSHAGAYGKYQDLAYVNETLIATSPPAPRNIRTTAKNGTSMTIEWDLASEAHVSNITVWIRERSGWGGYFEPTMHHLGNRTAEDRNRVVIEGLMLSSIYDLRLQTHGTQGNTECLATRPLLPGPLRSDDTGNFSAIARRSPTEGNNQSSIRLFLRQPAATVFTVSVRLVNGSWHTHPALPDTAQVITCLDVGCSNPIDVNSTYEVRVETSDGTNAGPTALRSVPPYAEPVDAPILAVLEFGYLQIALSWHEVVGATHYKLQYRQSAGDIQFMDVPCGSSLMTGELFWVRNLQASTLYDFRIVAVGATSETYHEVDSVVNQLRPTASIPQGYPNVWVSFTNGTLTIECSHPEALRCTYEIYDDTLSVTDYVHVGTSSSPGQLDVLSLPNGTSLADKLGDPVRLRVSVGNNHGDQDRTQGLVVIKVLLESNVLPGVEIPQFRRVELLNDAVVLAFTHPSAASFRLEVQSEDSWIIVKDNIQVNEYRVECLVDLPIGAQCSAGDTPTQFSTYTFRVRAGNANGYRSILYGATLSATLTTLPPQETQGLRLTQVTTDSISLAWDDQPDTVWYAVQHTYPGNSSEWFDAPGGGELFGTTFTVTGLESDQTHLFRVIPRLQDGILDGTGASSAAVVVAGQPTSVAPRVNESATVHISAVTASTVTIAFVNVVATRYKIQARELASMDPAVEIAGGDGWVDLTTNVVRGHFTMQQSHPDRPSPVVPGRLYELRVVSGNNHGWQADELGSLARVSAANTVPLRSPGNLAVVAINATTVSLKWDPSPDASKYRINMAANGSSSFSEVAQALTMSTFTVTDLLPGTQYRFSVVPGNSYGDAASAVSATIDVYPTHERPDSTPPQVTRSRVSAGEVRLMLTHPQAAGFAIQSRMYPVETPSRVPWWYRWTPLALPGSTNLSWYDVAHVTASYIDVNRWILPVWQGYETPYLHSPRLTQGDRVEIRVMATNGAGQQEEESGTVILIESSGLSPRAAVTSLRALSFQNDSIVLAWDDDQHPDATHYNVYQAMASISSPLELVATVPAKATQGQSSAHVLTYEAKQLDGSQERWFVVTASNSHGHGPQAPPVALRSTSSSPQEMDRTTARVEEVTQTRAVVRLHCATATGFLIERRVRQNSGGYSWTSFLNVTGFGATFDGMISVGQTYSLRARPVNNHGIQIAGAGYNFELTVPVSYEPVWGLRLLMVSDTWATVAWEAQPGETSYTCWVRAPGSLELVRYPVGIKVGEWTYEPLLQPLHASITLTSLTPEQEVEVAIAAGEAPLATASIVSFTPTARSPDDSVAVQVNVHRLERNRMVLACHHVQATHYDVHVRDDDGLSGMNETWEYAARGIAQSHVTVACVDESVPCQRPLVEGRRYSVRVLAVNRFGRQANASAAVHVVTPTEQAPASAMVSGLHVMRVDRDAYTVAWNPSNDATYYRVTESPVQAAEGSPLPHMGMSASSASTSSAGEGLVSVSSGGAVTNTTRFEHVGRADGLQTVTVEALNDKGVGVGSASSVQVMKSVSVAAEPAWIIHTELEDGQSVRLEWEQVPTASMYIVFKSVQAAGEDGWTLVANTSETQYTADNLIQDTLYKFRVEARNSNSYDIVQSYDGTTTDGSGTKAEDVLVSAAPRPIAVSGIRVAHVDDSRVTVIWDALASADQYDVEVYEASTHLNSSSNTGHLLWLQTVRDPIVTLFAGADGTWWGYGPRWGVRVTARNRHGSAGQFNDGRLWITSRIVTSSPLTIPLTYDSPWYSTHLVVGAHAQDDNCQRPSIWTPVAVTDVAGAAPDTAPMNLTFNDTDCSPGMFGGDVLFTLPTDAASRDNIKEYAVYAVSSTGIVLTRMLASMMAPLYGQLIAELTIPMGTGLDPSKRLAVCAVNDRGVNTTHGCTTLEVTDAYRPLSTAAYVAIVLPDTNTSLGHIDMQLRVGPPADTTDVDGYKAYMISTHPTQADGTSTNVTILKSTNNTADPFTVQMQTMVLPSLAPQVAVVTYRGQCESNQASQMAILDLATAPPLSGPAAVHVSEDRDCRLDIVTFTIVASPPTTGAWHADTTYYSARWATSPDPNTTVAAAFSLPLPVPDGSPAPDVQQQFSGLVLPANVTHIVLYGANQHGQSSEWSAIPIVDVTVCTDLNLNLSSIPLPATDRMLTDGAPPAQGPSHMELVGGGDQHCGRWHATGTLLVRGGPVAVEHARSSDGVRCFWANASGVMVLNGTTLPRPPPSYQLPFVEMDTMAHSSADSTITFDSVFIASNTAYANCFHYNRYGLSSTGITLPFTDAYVADIDDDAARPTVYPAEIIDMDPRAGRIDANFTIQAPSDEKTSEMDGYEIVFGHENGPMLDRNVTTMALLGGQSRDVVIQRGTNLPPGASRIFVLPRNGLCVGHGFTAVNAQLTDVIAQPSVDGLNSTTAVDLDCRRGVAHINLTLVDSIGNTARYSLHWLDDQGIHSQGSIVHVDHPDPNEPAPFSTTVLVQDVRIPSNASRLVLIATNSAGFEAPTRHPLEFIDREPLPMTQLVEATPGADSDLAGGAVDAQVVIMDAHMGANISIWRDLGGHVIANPTPFKPTTVNDLRVNTSTSNLVVLTWTASQEALSQHIFVTAAGAQEDGPSPRMLLTSDPSSVTITLLSTASAATSTVGPAVQTASLYGLNSNTLYELRVDSVNNHGIASGQVLRHVITGQAPSAPPEPVSVLSVQETSAVLTWPHVSDASGYQYSVHDVVAGVEFLNGTFTSTEQAIHLQVTGLIPRTVYNVSVVAVNTHGVTDNSSSAVIATTNRAPDSATHVQAKDPTNTEVTVEWQAPQFNSAINWSIQYNLYSGGRSAVWTAALNQTGHARSARVRGLSAGGAYRFRVVAVNTHGYAGSRNTASATTTACPLRTVGPACHACNRSLLEEDECVLNDAIMNANGSKLGVAASNQTSSINGSITEGAQSLSPSGGVLEGHTAVRIVVDSSFPISEIAYVRFGRLSGEQRCCPVGARRAVCMTPPASTEVRTAGGGDVMVQVSSDLVAWHTLAPTYTYYDHPAGLFAMQPTVGPMEGGSIVLIDGDGLQKFLGGNHVTARFGNKVVRPSGHVTNGGTAFTLPSQQVAGPITVWLSLNEVDYRPLSTLFDFYPTPVTSRVEPSAGPVTGGVVTIHGSGFDVSSVGAAGVLCRFGQWGDVRAESYTNDTVVCRAPSTQTRLHPIEGHIGEVKVQVALNGPTNGHFTESSATYTYYRTTLKTMSPPAVPRRTITTVVIGGHGFESFGSVLTTRCAFNGVPAVALARTDTEVVCEVPAFQDSDGAAELSLSVNGVHYVGADPPLRLELYTHPVLNTVDVTGGPTSGSTLVTVYGSGITNYGNASVTTVMCAFGHTSETGEARVVDAQTYAPSLVQCISPQGNVAQEVAIRVALNGQDFTLAGPQFVYYDDPLPATLSDVAMPVGGMKDLTLTGDGFDALGDVSRARCRIEGAWVGPTLCMNSPVALIVCPLCTCFDVIDQSTASSMPLLVDGNGAWMSFDLGQNKTVSALRLVREPNCTMRDVVIEIGPGPLTDQFDNGWQVVHNHTLEQTVVSGDSFTTITGFDRNSRYWRFRVVGTASGASKVTLRTLEARADDAHAIAGNVKAVSPSQMVCQIDQQNQGIATNYPSGQRQVVVSVNGQNDHRTSLSVMLYAPPTITGTSPTGAPSHGNTSVTIVGSGFNAYDTGIHTGAGCRFNGIHGIPIHKNDSAIVCVTPVAVGMHREAVVELSLYQGDWFVSPTALNLFPSPVLLSVTPNVGAASGGTLLRVSGRGLGVHGSNVAQCMCMFRALGVAEGVAEKVTPAEAVDRDRETIDCYSAPWSLGLDNSSGFVQVQLLVSINGLDFVPSYKDPNFDDSNRLEFTYYLDANITEIVPRGGPVAGDTSVALFGTQLEDVSFCRFGMRDDMVVPAVFNSTSGTLECVTVENSGGAESLAVFTSLNGQNYKDCGLRYEFYRPPLLEALPITGGVFGGGTRVPIVGSGFSIIATAGPNITTCKFGDVVVYLQESIDPTGIACISPAAPAAPPVSVTVAVAMNGQDYSLTPTQFRYYAPANLSYVYPRGVPTGQNHSLQVIGSGFLNHGVDGVVRCRLDCTGGTTYTNADIDSDVAITCLLPVFRQPGTCQVTVALNGADFEPAQLPLFLYDHPVLDGITPLAGLSTYLANESAVTIIGTGLDALSRHGVNVVDDNVALCKFGGASSLSTTGFDTTGVSTGGIDTAVTNISATSVVCQWPTGVPFGHSTVSISLNGEHYSLHGSTTPSLQSYAPPSFTSTEPTSVPATSFGSAVFIVRGSGFDAFGDVSTTRCRLGGTNGLAGQATYRTASQIDCSVEVTSLGLLSVEVSLYGEDFVPAFPDPVQLGVYLAPNVTGLQPQSGSPLGGETIVVTGEGLVGTEGRAGVWCRIGGVAFAASTATNGQITCVTPTDGSLLGGSWPFAVSLNGGRSWDMGTNPIEFAVSCAALGGDERRCVAGKRCGLCQDMRTITNITGGLNVTHVATLNYSVVWDPGVAPNAEELRVQRLTLHGSAVTTYVSEYVSAGEIGPAERTFYEHPYQRPFDIIATGLAIGSGSYNDTAIEAGGKYRYLVQVRMGSSWVTIARPHFTVPASYVLSWPAVPVDDVASVTYSIRRAEVDSHTGHFISPWRTVGTLYSGTPSSTGLSSLGVSYTDTALKPGARYTYEIEVAQPRCVQCGSSGCAADGQGYVSGAETTCTRWSFTGTLANPPGVGQSTGANATVHAGQTHYYRVVPPLPSLIMRVSVMFDSAVVVRTARGRLPSPSSYDMVGQRISSPMLLDVPLPATTCAGKVLPNGWFQPSGAGVYAPQGCDEWVVAVANEAETATSYADPLWGGGLQAAARPATYNLTVFYDFLFESFDCVAANGDCALFGLVGQGDARLASIQKSNYTGPGSAATSAPASVSKTVLRLTESVPHASTPQSGSWFYGAKLPLGKGFDTTFEMRFERPSTCTAPEEVLSFARTNDVRRTNYYADEPVPGSYTSSLVDPPRTSLADSLARRYTSANPELLRTTPVTGVKLPVGASSLAAHECSETGRGRIGGEGIALVMHSDPRGLDAGGCAGVGVGYAASPALNCTERIQQSLALEFDSFFNVSVVEDQSTRGLSPEQAHTRITYTHRNTLSLFRDGVNDHSDPIASVSLRQHHHIPFDDGLLHVVRVSYIIDPAETSGRLSVWVDNRQVLSELVSSDGWTDASGAAYLGFTGSTGVTSERHDISSWRFCSRANCGAESG